MTDELTDRVVTEEQGLLSRLGSRLSAGLRSRQFRVGFPATLTALAVLAVVGYAGLRYKLNQKFETIVAYATNNGRNGSPKEIEDVISQMPEVIEVAAIGIPDNTLGEAVKVFIVPASKKDGFLRQERILDWCKDRLPEYKVPKEVGFLTALPKNSFGKILFGELQ